MASNPRLKLVEVAARYVGIEETSRNRFPHDREIWSSTNYPDGWENREPYCAAFICHVVRLADQESLDLEFPTRPQNAAVRDWKDWARRPTNGVLIFTGHAAMRPEPGDIVSFLPHFSHIGLVERYDDETKTVFTIEGNTNGVGDRDGDGIWRRARKLDLCGEFYRLPARARAAKV